MLGWFYNGSNHLSHNWTSCSSILVWNHTSVFKWYSRCALLLFWNRLFTVPYFLVRSFRYTASYRHGYLDFQMYRGAGVRIIARIMTQVFPRSLSSFDTHARWQPVTQSARSRWSYGKIEDCEQSNYEIISIISDQTVQFSYCCQLLLFLLLTYRLRKLISWTDCF